MSLDKAEIRRLSRHCLRYRDADDRKAWFQLGSTLGLFLLVAGLMLYGAASEAYALLVLFLPACGLLVRLFGVQHDCGHNSFFASRKTNRLIGRLLSVFTLTPFGYWSRSHAVHHTTVGDLGRRGIGDVDTLTVDEYAALPRGAKPRYRIYRHPLFLHVFGPPFYFILLQRSPFGQALPVPDATSPRWGWTSSRTDR